MKNFLIIYNVIFLLFGHVLFSNIHYLHDHHHANETDETHETHECQECVIIESSNNYVLDSQEVKFLNNNINLFVYKYFNIFDCRIEQSYLSRAPPIS